MNAPGFLRRRTPNDERQVRGLPPLPHPVDLDQAANTVDLYAGKAKQQRTEAQVVGDTAEQAVMRATQLSKEVIAMIDKSKAIVQQIESAGLRLIAEAQRQQDEFNNRAETFMQSAVTLHDGLLDVLAKVGKKEDQKVVDVETRAAALESGLAEMVQGHAAERN